MNQWHLTLVWSGCPLLQQVEVVGKTGEIDDADYDLYSPKRGELVVTYEIRQRHLNIYHIQSYCAQ